MRTIMRKTFNPPYILMSVKLLSFSLTLLVVFTSCGNDAVQRKPSGQRLPVLKNPTAICRDGTYSYSQTRQGTCSHHGGVAVWLD